MNKDCNIILCPNCDAPGCYIYKDSKPPSLDVACYECGLMITTVISYLSLEQLNQQRGDNNLGPLSELPIQNLYT